MAKASEPGRTKTRLVPPLSFEEASALNTAFLRDVATNILAASQTASIAGYVAFGPPETEKFFAQILPSAISTFECWHADFGDCLFGAIQQLFDYRHDAAIVLNSDGPTLPTSLLTQAAEILAQPGDRMVLGPAEDGGYYLLGIKAGHRRLFEDIAWSTERVAQQTLARAREIGLTVDILPYWYDVDDTATLRRLMAELFGAGSNSARLKPYQAEQTANLLRTLRADDNFQKRIEAHVAPPVIRAAP